MKVIKGLKTKRKANGKRFVKVSKKLKDDFLVSLKDRLEDDHIKKYTFIVKGSKMYTAGVFWSEKNKRKFVFRSTYEFAYFYQLEADANVLGYVVEPFEIAYVDPTGKGRKVYRPDVLVSYADGKIKLLEIKPKSKVTSPEVKAKAASAREFLKENFPHIEYEFITEDQIFKKPSDYTKLLGRIDPEKYKKRMDRKGRDYKKEAAEKPSLDYFKSKLSKTMKYAPCMLI